MAVKTVLACLALCAAVAATAPETRAQPAGLEGAQALSARGHAEARRGNLDAAVALHERALALAEKALGPGHAGLDAFIDSLVRTRIARERGDARLADPRHWELMRLQRQADAAAEATDYPRAIALYERALPLAEALYPEAETQNRMLIDRLGEMHDANGDYGAALRYFGRLLQIVERAFGPDSPQAGNALISVAKARRMLGEHGQALELLDRALALAARDPEARAYLDIFRVHVAHVYREMGRPAQALPLYERGLAAQEALLGRDHQELVGTLVGLGKIYRAMARHADAQRVLDRALALREGRYGARHLGVTEPLAALAEVHQAAGRYAEALRLRERDVEIREKLAGAQHPHLAASLNNLGGSYREMGRYALALPLYERSLAIHEKTYGAEHPKTATSLNNLAGLYLDMGEYAQARLLYEKSRAIRERSLGRDHADVAASLHNLAGLHADIGEPAKAIALYRRSLEIQAAAPHSARLAVTHGSLATVLAETGEYAAALALQEKALAIVEQAFGPEHPEVAPKLNNLAVLYHTLGQYAKALELTRRSLALNEKAFGAGHPRVATNLNNIASLHKAAGDHAKALPLYERSLALSETALGPEHPDVATSLNNLANLYVASGEYAKAPALYARALTIRRKALGPHHPVVATSLHDFASLHQASGEPQKALPLLEEALRIGMAAGDADAIWRAQDGLRAALADLKQPHLAIFFGKEAVNTVQGLRARMRGIERELQRSFLGSKEWVYRGLADLLIEEGRLPEAQQVLAMLKEEEFFDFIRRDAQDDPRATQAALTGQEEAWRKRYRDASERLTALGAEHEALRARARFGLSEAEQKRRAGLEEDLRAARLAFDRFLAALMKEAEQAGASRAREVGERGLGTLRALQGTLGSLGEGVVALHYVMGQERLSILLTTPSVQVARSAPIKAADLNRLVERYRRALQNPPRDARPLARELHAALIAPVAEDLRQANARTLMVSLDGALRYVPLAALHDGKRYLVEDYRIAIFTEAAKDKLKDRPQADWRLAGLGLTRAVEGFSPLPAVRQELEGIIAGAGEGVLPGEVHLDDAFTAQRLRGALDRAYPVLHIASHFVFRPGAEANSFLLLGDGTRLTLREVKEDNFDFRDVDLITLSACETAVGGGRDANGAEIEGFGALAQRQGARAVIATLWPVADESTGQLMQSFYRIRQGDRVTKAEALRRAQLELLDNGRYAHPFFWAPFILMGNWL